MRITTKYEWLVIETERVDSELVCLKRKNEDLNDSFNEVIDQRDTEQSEVIALNEKLKMLQNEKTKMSDALKGKHDILCEMNHKKKSTVQWVRVRILCEVVIKFSISIY